MRHLLLVLVLLATACTGETETSEEDRGDARSRQVVNVAGCPGAGEALADPGVFLPGEIEADVDGDGAFDRVRLAAIEGDLPECETLLVAEGAQTYAIALGSEEIPVTLDSVRLADAVEIDGEAGAEIVVYLVRGASTEFVGLFSIGSGELRQVAVEGGDYGDLFPTGGSVGHLEASDCTGGGDVIVSIAEPRGGGLSVKRTTFSSSPDSLRRSGSDSVTVDDPQDLERFPEFAAAPFGSCSRE